MQDTLKWLVVVVLLLVSGAIQADPIQDNALNDYKAGWYPNLYKTKLLACPDACRYWVDGVAEHEQNLATKGGVTNLCKIPKYQDVVKPNRGTDFVYGNQPNNTPVCGALDVNGRAVKSKRFFCLCVAGMPCSGPDLVVTKINKPQWDSVNHRSIVTA